MRAEFERCGSLADWQAFADSWNDLEVDPYLAEQGRYRRRRYAMYAIDAAGAIAREPHGPHYQGREYNQLFGGVERWFEPILPAVSDSASMQTILRWTHGLFTRCLIPAGSGSDRDQIGIRLGSDLGGMSKRTSSASRRAWTRPASRRRKASTATASTTCSSSS
jgi:hypothetical protein